MLKIREWNYFTLLYFIEFAMVTQHGDRDWNRTYVPINMNPFISHPDYDLPPEQQCGLFYVPKNQELYVRRGLRFFHPYLRRLNV